MPSAINKPLYRRTLFNLFDARVKAVFRHLIVARDLMTHHLALDWPPGDEPNMSRIEALPQEWIAPGRNLERRTADMVWLVRDRDGGPQLAVLLECQSRYDSRMSRRMARYTLLLGQALARQGLHRADSGAVPILPAVFHAGPYPWARPWERIASSPDLPQAAILQPGRTIDIHAYADDELPPRNLASCMINLERGRYQMDARGWGLGPPVALRGRGAPAVTPGAWAGAGTGFRRVHRGRLPGTVSGSGLCGAGSPFLAGVEAKNDYVVGNLPKRTAGGQNRRGGARC